MTDQEITSPPDTAEEAISKLRDRLVADPSLAIKAHTSNLPGYRHSFDPAFVDALVELRGVHTEFFSRAVEDHDYRREVVDDLRSAVYQTQRS